MYGINSGRGMKPLNPVQYPYEDAKPVEESIFEVSNWFNRPPSAPDGAIMYLTQSGLESIWVYKADLGMWITKTQLEYLNITNIQANFLCAQSILTRNGRIFGRLEAEYPGDNRLRSVNSNPTSYDLCVDQSGFYEFHEQAESGMRNPNVVFQGTTSGAQQPLEFFYLNDATPAIRLFNKANLSTNNPPEFRLVSSVPYNNTGFQADFPQASDGYASVVTFAYQDIPEFRNEVLHFCHYTYSNSLSAMVDNARYVIQMEEYNSSERGRRLIIRLKGRGNSGEDPVIIYSNNYYKEFQMIGIGIWYRASDGRYEVTIRSEQGVENFEETADLDGTRNATCRMAFLPIRTEIPYLGQIFISGALFTCLLSNPDLLNLPLGQHLGYYSKRKPTYIDKDNIFAAYSLGLANFYHTGPLIRVRRSGDSAELDIDQLNDGLNLDQLQWFIDGGGGEGYIVTFYDQSGEGRDMTTTGDDYMIASGGQVFLDNGLPYFTRVAETDDMTWSGTEEEVDTVCWYHVVRRELNSTSLLMELSGDTDKSALAALAGDAVQAQYLGETEDSAGGVWESGDGVWRNVYGHVGENLKRVWVDGNMVIDETTTQGGANFDEVSLAPVENVFYMREMVAYNSDYHSEEIIEEIIQGQRNRWRME